ncbi:MAG TPA: phosphoethanolamine transferase [Sulfurospirillum sp. UBA12182]|nr:MAG TPA: phosphoethanolamine transferase [Sulfurospirillum sp. UBA12182]
MKYKFKPLHVVICTSLFIVLFNNYSFFKEVLKIYPFSLENSLFLLSLIIVLFLAITLILILFATRYTLKPILVFFLIISSVLNYFMVTYHIVIDSEMIRNAMQTDYNETFDLLSVEFFLYLFFLGILPSIFVIKAQIEYKPFVSNLLSKLKYTAFIVGIVLLIVFSLSKFYTSFFREHKPLRYYTNPTYFLYSFGKYISKSYEVAPRFHEVGKDAKTVHVEADEKKELIILVVGEAARADRFSLNGYDKKTNPLLEKEELISFSNMYSCGTSTAYSVPCMFSLYDKEHYSYKKGISTSNILDVLKETGDISILWRDNNSDSKGVALRVEYEDFKTSKNNSKCDDIECRDEGMLVGLDKYIKNHKNKDILIVLHQMGNHGPAYYKRYPKEFEKFKPTCKTNQLEKCSTEEISNAYDNAILYTDYFLSNVIKFLKPYSKDYETAMLYMSDHGESLGENSVYLHGMPYLIAPENQKHIASFIWLGEGEMRKEYDEAILKQNRQNLYSQDNLFHTLLGLFEVSTDVYEKRLDILSNARINEGKE